MIFSLERCLSLFLTRCLREELATSARIARTSELLNFGPVSILSVTELPVIEAIGTAPQRHDHGQSAEAYDSASSSCSRLAVSIFTLSRLPLTERFQLLTAMREQAEYLFLADFKLPERNIEIPGSFFLRGIACLAFPLQQDFIRSGGLENLVYLEKSLSPVRRATRLGGGIQCILLRSHTEA